MTMVYFDPRHPLALHVTLACQQITKSQSQLTKQMGFDSFQII